MLLENVKRSTYSRRVTLLHVRTCTSEINSFDMPSGSSALNRTAVSLPIQDIILIRDTIGPKGHPVETFALTATVKRFAYINALLPYLRRRYVFAHRWEWVVRCRKIGNFWCVCTILKADTIII